MTSVPSQPAVVDPVSSLLEMIGRRLPAEQSPEASDFARIYYAQVATEDLAERSLDDLYGAALSHWHFARIWAGPEPKLRVYNPRADEHGWQSTHTVIDIVNADMPFLVDSIAMEVNRQGLTMHLIVHPVMRIRRDAKHWIVAIADSQAALPDGQLESLIHVEVDRRTEPAALDALRDGLLAVLAQVRLAVTDWQPMREKLLEIAAELERGPVPATAGDVGEDIAFLRWLAEHHFTLLGYRDHDLVSDALEGDQLRISSGSGLGILRDRTEAPRGPEQRSAGVDAGYSASFASLPAAIRARAHEPRLLLLTKSNNRSTVHRPGYLDYVGIKRFDKDGRVVGERRFVGLYTSIAYAQSPHDIPILRRKVDAVVDRAHFLPASHAAKAFKTIIEHYPRDELFQIDEDQLLATATGILRLGERQRTRLFVRHDVFGRFVSCLIFVPRENYNTDLRVRIQSLLVEAFEGNASEFSVQFSESPLARLWIVVRTPAAASVDVPTLERRIVLASRRWEDELREALVSAVGEERGNALCRRYAGGMSAGYREGHTPRVAVRDIEQMEQLNSSDDLVLNLYAEIGAAPGHLRFKLYRAGALAPLSHSLPMLELMGVVVLDELPFEIRRADGVTIWIEDFGIAAPGGEEVDVERLRERFHEAFLRTWRAENESDPFNRLVLAAGLDWRSVTILRAYARFMKQATSAYSQAYVEQALASQPAITRALIRLFETRFDPSFTEDREAAESRLSGEIEALLEQVSNLDEDRILRQYLALIRATVRTNFFRHDGSGRPRPVLSLKFESARIPGLPEPRPLFEIFTYSPRFEGVHLRGGRVARGGLRWSDRPEDFRTEVLGLAKAQQVKNAVIVPVGSKGGFVLKRAPSGDREALRAEGVACYQAYLRGLLDLTDNLVDGRVVPPPSVVRHDPDDTYLVVAADKGTAEFSDIANAVSAEYDFWLGDAFASGGSVGYDHKKMGITARGAWESVKRRFRTLGVDTQSQDFTVVGVGDMSGDVFGNGLLLSRHIRLIAAFDHRHIFIDPEPDAHISFGERERLFAMPRSSWADYDTRRISAGGGVWPRTAKSIPLSAAARAALGVEAARLAPGDLLSVILKAPVDLFYNGGIGTYIKASNESNADCGDRANDAIRIDAAELRCKVVAEGGNLGVTQRGRIEFALAGGLIGSDAIDNSAGVDCSDHEVNIKILLNGLVADGELTGKQRNRLLSEMTDEVSLLVLKDNIEQNRILGVARSGASELFDEQVRLMRDLSARGLLNRRVEFLPSDDVLVERRQAGSGLTTPELAVLLAYSKMALFDEVLDSDVPGDPGISAELSGYFPRRLSERFAAQMQRHPLRREIIATQVVNAMVNRVGPAFVHRLVEETGAASADVVRAYIAARDIFDLPSLWSETEALDHRVEVREQDAIVLASIRLLRRAVKWLLRHRLALKSLAATIDRYSRGVASIGEGLDGWLSPFERDVLAAEVRRMVGAGIPEPLARRVSRLEALTSALDIVEVAAAQGLQSDTVAAVYFGVGGRLELGWLGEKIEQLPADSHWQALARVAMRDDLSALARALAHSALEGVAKENSAKEKSAKEKSAKGPGGLAVPIESLIAEWSARRELGLGRWKRLLADMKATAAIDMAMVSVMLTELRGLV